MDIKNATIESIGEIQIDPTSGKEILAIEISTNSTPKRKYVIYRNPKYAFDILKNFERNVFKVGDKIDFNYNETQKGSFNSIWRILNHKSIQIQNSKTKIMDKSFKITWTIELNAPNELEAALLALEIQRDSKSEALNFDVKEVGSDEVANVDLSNVRQ